MNKSADMISQPPQSITIKQLYYQHQFDFAHLWIRIAAATLLCLFMIRSHGSQASLPILSSYAVLALLAFGNWYSSISFTSYRTLKPKVLKNTLQRHGFISLLFSTAWSFINYFLYQNASIDLTIQVTLLLIISILITNTILSSAIEFYLHIVILFLPFIGWLLLNGKASTQLLAIALVFAAIAIAFIAHTVAQLINYLNERNLSLQLQLPIDPVTHLINYQHFSQVIKGEWRRAARHQQQISLQLIQIDDFSSIKKSCSTDTLDQHLHLIADSMGRIARRSGDILARYNESTFIILFPDTNQKDSLLIAEKISQRIKNMQLIKAEGKKETLTASIGAAICSPIQVNEDNNATHQESIALSPAALINAADRALQRAKSKGNQGIEFKAL